MSIYRIDAYETDCWFLFCTFAFCRGCWLLWHKDSNSKDQLLILAYVVDFWTNFRYVHLHRHCFLSSAGNKQGLEKTDIQNTKNKLTSDHKLFPKQQNTNNYHTQQWTNKMRCQNFQIKRCITSSSIKTKQCVYSYMSLNAMHLKVCLTLTGIVAVNRHRVVLLILKPNTNS